MVIRWRMVLLTTVLACALVGSVLAEAAAKPRIIYNHDGNLLILFGGPKDSPPDLRSYQSQSQRPRPDGVIESIRIISDYSALPFGDGFVRTEFTSIVEYGSSMPLRVWRNVEGETETFWAGTEPQYNSSQIHLSESWYFSGVLVSISFPAGAGFSAGGSTINWSGSDTSGTNWRMAHAYVDLYADSCIFMNNVTQTSVGSHDFQTAGEWKTTRARDSS